MLVIRDTNGKIIQRSRNLRGIRQYVGKHVIKVLSIDPIAKGERRRVTYRNGY